MLLITEILQLPNPQIKHCLWGASGLVRGEPWIKYLNNWIQSCKSEVPGAVRRPSKEMILKQDLKDYFKWTKRRQESSRRRNRVEKLYRKRKHSVSQELKKGWKAKCNGGEGTLWTFTLEPRTGSRPTRALWAWRHLSYPDIIGKPIEGFKVKW